MNGSSRACRISVQQHDQRAIPCLRPVEVDEIPVVQLNALAPQLWRGVPSEQVRKQGLRMCAR